MQELKTQPLQATSSEGALKPRGCQLVGLQRRVKMKGEFKLKWTNLKINGGLDRQQKVVDLRADASLLTYLSARQMWTG